MFDSVGKKEEGSWKRGQKIGLEEVMKGIGLGNNQSDN
jgi:hypothetical protein